MSSSPGASDAIGLKYHAACTAMALADYCGEGQPNTVSGTPILMFNANNVNPDPTNGAYIAGGPFGATNDFFFEAAWAGEPTQDGSYRGKALCLTKKRWNTL